MPFPEVFWDLGEFPIEGVINRSPVSADVTLLAMSSFHELLTPDRYGATIATGVDNSLAATLQLPCSYLAVAVQLLAYVGREDKM